MIYQFFSKIPNTRDFFLRWIKRNCSTLIVGVDSRSNMKKKRIRLIEKKLFSVALNRREPLDVTVSTEESFVQMFICFLLYSVFYYCIYDFLHLSTKMLTSGCITKPHKTDCNFFLWPLWTWTICILNTQHDWCIPLHREFKSIHNLHRAKTGKGMHVFFGLCYVR